MDQAPSTVAEMYELLVLQGVIVPGYVPDSMMMPTDRIQVSTYLTDKSAPDDGPVRSGWVDHS